MRNFKKYGSMKGIVLASFALLCVLGVYMSMNLFSESYAETTIGTTASYYRYDGRFKSNYKHKYKKPGRSSKSSKSDIGYMYLVPNTGGTLNVYCALRGKTLSSKVNYYRYNFDQFYASKSAEWRTKLANIVTLYYPGSDVTTLKNYLAANYPNEYVSGGLSALTAKEASAAFQTAVWVFTNNDSGYTASTSNSSRNKRINTLHSILLQSNGYLKNVNSNITSINFMLNKDLALNESTGKYEASIKTSSAFNQNADNAVLTLTTNKGTVVSQSSYTTNYTTSGSDTIMNIVFNDGVFGSSASGKITLSSNNEEFDTIYINVNVRHSSSTKTVFVYKTSGSNYQNLIGTENAPINSTSYVNLTAPELAKVSIEIDKVDEENLSGYALNSAHLQLYRVDGTTNTLITEWLSSETAKVITDLQPGTYKIVETLYPEGYDKSTKSTTVDNNNIYVASGVNFELTSGHEKFFVHVMNKQTEIKIKKVDSTGNTFVENALIAIVDSEGEEQYRFTSTTDAVSIKGTLDTGIYFLVELEAPTNYVKSDKVYRFAVGNPDSNAPNTITDGEYQNREIIDATYNASTGVISLPNKEGISISKKSIDEDAVYVIGATLVITDANGNEVDKWVTTAEDHIVTVELADGKYTLTETIPGPGYATAESIEFEIANGKVVNNTNINMKDAPLQVCFDKKATNVSGNLAGAEFELYNEANELVTKFTTTTESYCVPVEVGLIPGNYMLKETKAPAGYKASANKQIVVSDTPDLQLYEVYNEVQVPITSLNTSSIIYIAIMVMGVTGIGLVCYYVKKYSY